jgi:hypothetical protein
VLDGSKTQEPADQSGLGYVVRMFWMAFGNFALFFAGLNIAASERIGIPDAVYAALTVALLLARWVDIAKLNGMTIYALPATRAHLRKYTLAVTGISLVGWVIAHYASMQS